MRVTDIENNYQAMRTWYHLSTHTSQHGDWAFTLKLEYTKKVITMQFIYDSQHSADSYVLIPQSQDFGTASWFFAWIKDEV